MSESNLKQIPRVLLFYLPSKIDPMGYALMTLNIPRLIESVISSSSPGILSNVSHVQDKPPYPANVPLDLPALY